MLTTSVVLGSPFTLVADGVYEANKPNDAGPEAFF